MAGEYRLTVRFPPELAAEIKEYSSLKGITVNEACISTMRSGLFLERDGVFSSPLLGALSVMLNEKLSAMEAGIRSSIDDLAEATAGISGAVSASALSVLAAAVDAGAEDGEDRDAAFEHYLGMAPLLAEGMSLAEADAEISAGGIGFWE